MAEVARERGVDPIDLVLDLALATNLEAALPHGGREQRRGRGRRAARAPDTCSASPTPARTRASSATRASRRTCSATGCARSRRSRSSRRSACSRRAPPTCSASATADAAPGLAADVTSSIPTPSAAGALRRVHDLPAGADRLVADAIGIDAVVVNGTVVRRGGRDAVDADGPLPGRCCATDGRGSCRGAGRPEGMTRVAGLAILGARAGRGAGAGPRFAGRQVEHHR